MLPSARAESPCCRAAQDELRRYQPLLLQSPTIVVANKVDSCEDAAAVLAQLKQHTAHPIVPVSAAHNVGIQRLKAALRMMAPPEVLQT